MPSVTVDPSAQVDPPAPDPGPQPATREPAALNQPTANPLAVSLPSPKVLRLRLHASQYGYRLAEFLLFSYLNLILLAILSFFDEGLSSLGLLSVNPSALVSWEFEPSLSPSSVAS